MFLEVLTLLAAAQAAPCTTKPLENSGVEWPQALGRLDDSQAMRGPRQVILDAYVIQARTAASLDEVLKTPLELGTEMGKRAVSQSERLKNMSDRLAQLPKTRTKAALLIGELQAQLAALRPEEIKLSKPGVELIQNAQGELTLPPFEFIPSGDGIVRAARTQLTQHFDITPKHPSTLLWLGPTLKLRGWSAADPQVLLNSALSQGALSRSPLDLALWMQVLIGVEQGKRKALTSDAFAEIQARLTVALTFLKAGQPRSFVKRDLESLRQAIESFVKTGSTSGN